MICTTCRENRGRFRRRLIRGFKALLFGSLAAAVGAGVYRMIMVGTGWNFSLVAVLVSYVVGGAVKSGSGDRGGWFYGFLAVFLTYSALVGMFLPEVWQGSHVELPERREARKRTDKENHHEVKADPGPKAIAKTAEDSGRPKSEVPPDAVAPKPGGETEAKTKPVAVDVPARPQEVGENPRPRTEHGLLALLGMLILAIVLLLGLVYSIPVVVGVQSPISLLIFGIALWQAWMMNRTAEPPVTGPYRIPG